MSFSEHLIAIALQNDVFSFVIFNSNNNRNNSNNRNKSSNNNSNNNIIMSISTDIFIKTSLLRRVVIIQLITV